MIFRVRHQEWKREDMRGTRGSKSGARKPDLLFEARDDMHGTRCGDRRHEGASCPVGLILRRRENHSTSNTSHIPFNHNDWTHGSRAQPLVTHLISPLLVV